MNYPIEDESQDRPISTPEEAGDFMADVAMWSLAAFIFFGFAVLIYAANP